MLSNFYETHSLDPIFRVESIFGTFRGQFEFYSIERESFWETLYFCLEILGFECKSTQFALIKRRPKALLRTQRQQKSCSDMFWVLLVLFSIIPNAKKGQYFVILALIPENRYSKKKHDYIYLIYISVRIAKNLYFI